MESFLGYVIRKKMSRNKERILIIIVLIDLILCFCGGYLLTNDIFGSVACGIVFFFISVIFIPDSLLT